MMPLSCGGLGEKESERAGAHVSAAHARHAIVCAFTPPKKVDKFKGEFVAQSKCGTGIFVSLTSGIARRKLLQYELVPDPENRAAPVRLLVFLPNAGADGGGAALVFALHFCNLFMQQQHEATAAAVPVTPSEMENRVHALHARLDAQLVRANDLLAQALAFEKHTTALEKVVREQRALSQRLKQSSQTMVHSLTTTITHVETTDKARTNEWLPDSASSLSMLEPGSKEENADEYLPPPPATKRVRQRK
jgi:hypothetical protein